jgi:hypothetical protein
MVLLEAAKHHRHPELKSSHGHRLAHESFLVLSHRLWEELTRCAIHPVTAATASSTGMPLIWLPSGNQKDTTPASMSFAPASSMNGTFLGGVVAGGLKWSVHQPTRGSRRQYFDTRST